MAEIPEAKVKLSTAAKELGNGYTASGEARKRVRSGLDAQAKNVELLDRIIASMAVSGEHFAESVKESRKSEESIEAAARSIGSLGLEASTSDSVSALPSRVAEVADNQNEYTSDVDNHRDSTEDFANQLRAMREELKTWYGHLEKDARDDVPEHVAFSDTVSQASASVYEI